MSSSLNESINGLIISDLLLTKNNFKIVEIPIHFVNRIYDAFENKPYQVFGGPAIGRLAYFSILFEWDRK
jgi:hypothetical protein